MAERVTRLVTTPADPLDAYADALAERIADKLAARLGQVASAPAPSVWLTRRQVAEALGVSTTTVDTLARNGVLTKHEFNGIVRFRRDDVERSAG